MDQKKTRLCDREIIYSVRKLSVKDRKLALDRARGDEWGKI